MHVLMSLLLAGRLPWERHRRGKNTGNRCTNPVLLLGEQLTQKYGYKIYCISQYDVNNLLVNSTQRCRERMKESRGKFLDRYRAISSASTEASVAGDSSTSPNTQIDLTVSNEDIRLSVREVMRREWESLREEESGLPQLPSSRASKEEYMEQVSNHTVCTCSFVHYHQWL